MPLSAKTTSEVSFTQATIDDLDYVTRTTLLLHEFETHKQPAKLQTNQQFELQIKEWMKLELLNPSSLIFLLHMSNKIVGFAFLKISDIPNEFTEYARYGVLQSIWIDEAYRKLALGKQTVSFVESIFREQGIQYYEVNYTSSNQVAGDFWRTCGLTETSITARKFL